MQALYQREYAAIDPAPAAMSNLKAGRAASTDLVFAATIERHKPFLEGFLYPLGLAGALAGVVANDGGKIGFFVLHRGLHRRVFDEKDVERFESVLPHVARMLSLRRAFFTVEAEKAARDAALDPMRIAVVSLDRGGRVTYANALSRVVLARGDGLYLDRFGRLMAVDTTSGGALRSLRDGTPVADAVFRVARTNRSSPYSVRICPPAEAGSPWRGSHVTLYISDPEPGSGIAPARLALALGLPPASARLIAALRLRGETLETYAKDAGISRHTAKFHLRAAFVATGARRQGDLLRPGSPERSPAT